MILTKPARQLEDSTVRVIELFRVGDDPVVCKRWGLPAIEAYLVTRYHVPASLLSQGEHVDAGLFGEHVERARSLASSDLDLSASFNTCCLTRTSPLKIRQTERCSSRLLCHDGLRMRRVLSSNAQRLLSQKDFHKSISHPQPDGGDVQRRFAKDRSFLNEQGFNTEADLLQATIRKRGYLPYVGGIILEDGRDASEHSELIRSSFNPTNTASFLSQNPFGTRWR